MVLAAGGETLWHVNSAAAAPPRGTVSLASTVSMLAAASTTATESNLLIPAPMFKPFVFVPLQPLALAGSLTLDETAGVHMNADGDVVATFIDDGDDNIYFWRDSGLSNGTSTLAGWQGPLKDEYGTAIVGCATGINNAEDIGICGTRDVSGTDTAFYYEFDNPDDREGTVYDIGAGYAYDVNENGVVVGASASGVPVAWSSSFETVPLPPLHTGGGTAAFGVDPDSTTNPYIAGTSEDADYLQAVVWYYASGWNVVDLSGLTTDTQYAHAVDTNGSGHIIGSTFTTSTGAVVDSSLWVYSSGPSWTQEELSSTWMASAINNETLPEVVGYVPGSVSAYLWVAEDLSHSTFDRTEFYLTDTVVGLPDDLLEFRPTDINDDGEIVGVAKIDAETDYWIPFKIVPYDTNNNGVPDYRDIIHDPTNYPDTTGADWLIDKSEEMRVGLYATGPDGVDSKAAEVTQMQIVRLHIHEEDLDNIVNNSAACATQNANLADWMEGGAEGAGPREILATIRCNDPAQSGHDRIYTESTSPTKDEYLDNLFAFAYRYAYSIDYIQIGNEIFGGAGDYYLYGISGCSNTDIGNLYGACFAAACAEVAAWIEEQVEVVRMASALAGRPLRIVSPAFTSLNALSGQNADLRNPGLTTDAERAGLAIKTIVDLANKHQLWTDIHLHYRTDTQLEDALYALDNPGEYSFDEPDYWACTEWSPTPLETWLQANSEEFGKYFSSNEAPAVDWDDFVYGWGTSGGGLARDPFPDFERDLDEMISYNLLMACYGEFWQGDDETPSPDVFYLTVVRASQVHPDGAWIDDPTNLWTKIRGDLQNDADGVLIDDFDPHPTTPTVDCGVIVPRP